MNFSTSSGQQNGRFCCKCPKARRGLRHIARTTYGRLGELQLSKSRHDAATIFKEDALRNLP